MSAARCVRVRRGPHLDVDAAAAGSAHVALDAHNLLNARAQLRLPRRPWTNSHKGSSAIRPGADAL